MYIARVLYPVEVLGPGKRVGIWFCGCERRCKGCSNPELWDFDPRFQTTPETVLRLIRQIAAQYPIDGFTLTGGDPMYQQEEMQKLIALLRPISPDILVYTGYRIEELPPSALWGISVLIDGEYLEDRNHASPLRGSDNQRIHFLDPSVKPLYGPCLAETGNRIQNFTLPDGIVSVGIHKPGFLRTLDQNVKTKGLKP